jgi:hypothetical protein
MNAEFRKNALAEQSGSRAMEKVRASAALVAEHARSVRIDEAGLAAFAPSLRDSVPPREAAQFPLQFSERSRVNFEVVRALLEFGSGFRLVLKQSTGRGAHETMTAGLFSLFITHGDISAATLVGQSLFDVSTLFSIPLSVEEAVPGVLAGVATQLVDSPVKALAVFIHRVLGDCGRILQGRNCIDFFDLLVKELRPSAAEPIDANRLIEMIASLFPAFNDVAEYHGQSVQIFKKAQLLCANLKQAFDSGSLSFGVSGVECVTVFADNVLPCVLRAKGVLVFAPELAARVDAGKVLPAGDEEVELRLVAVEACERLLKASGISTRRLDLYLWELGKEAPFRELNRHYTQNTIFY